MCYNAVHDVRNDYEGDGGVMRCLAFNEDGVAAAVEVLCGGGVVIVPTDTVYGVACHPDFPEALERIRAMKGRDAAKPFQLLAASVEAVWKDGAMRSAEAERLATHWPGALTLVLPTSKGHPEGYRVPDEPLLQRLLTQCGGLLRCTSVNLSGEPPARDAQEAVEALGAAVDLVLDGGAAKLGTSSTVAQLTEDGAVRVLRQGEVEL